MIQNLTSQIVTSIAIVLMGLQSAAVQNASELRAIVETHCKEKKCACYSNNIDGLNLTFGNGSNQPNKALLKIQPQHQFSYRQNEMLPLAEAEASVEIFNQKFNLSEISQNFCINNSSSEKGYYEFLTNVRSTLLDRMFFEQLQNNGGFCNPHQKCECEFAMGGNEMAPDFSENFEIGVTGGQEFIYTGGSSAGQIRSPDNKAIFVKSFGKLVGKSSQEKEDFIQSQLLRLEVFQPLCRDFEGVRTQGKNSLLSLIQELESPTPPDEDEGHDEGNLEKQ